MTKPEESDPHNALPATEPWEHDTYSYALQRSEHPYISEDEFRRQFQLDGQLWGGLALVLVIIFVPLIYFVFFS